MRIATSEIFSELQRQLAEAFAEFNKTGDETVRWRIGELCQAIKTTLPRTLADRLTKLALAVDMRIDRSREEDWVLFRQVHGRRQQTRVARPGRAKRSRG